MAHRRRGELLSARRRRTALEGALDRLALEWDARDVHLLAGEGDGSVVLMDLERDDRAPKGSGRLALDALLAVADAARRDVTLALVTRDERLARFYRAAGFEDDGEGEDGDPVMRRRFAADLRIDHVARGRHAPAEVGDEGIGEGVGGRGAGRDHDGRGGPG